ncbi:hypothetical protein [Streptomyces sp. NRRL S-1022]|uniref:hypothetical protein n=1 Tax=Streptomyces sp. NRRL S-1022 TaxID=1463880 RepID=UPI0004BECDE4|nr:hypothetical protein [Streptomyces sp. NRRL S-1022]
MDQNIMVTVEDAHQERIKAVADQLRAAGMRVRQVLPTIGVITGTVSDSQRDAIGNVGGVARVEEQEAPQVPPPDAEIQ